MACHSDCQKMLCIQILKSTCNNNYRHFLKKPQLQNYVIRPIRTTPKFFSQGVQRTPTPFERFNVPAGSINKKNLVKSLLFSIAFSTGSFIGVSIWEYEQVRARALKSLKNQLPFSWFTQKFYGGQKKVQTWQKDLDTWWSSISHADKVFIPICALNVLVFILWRVPKIQPIMMKYFCSNPGAQAVCWPMFLSTFSHYSLFHIFANMYVLHTFTNAAVASLGKHQFLGVYLSAGVLASFGSFLYKGLLNRGGLSLGASGAIMGILAFVCTQYPHTQLSIIFLPMYTFTAGIAIKVIMGIDLAGLLLGWRYFDHAAHLGGAVFGLFWSYYGAHYLWPKREFVLREYHKLRSMPKPPKN